MHRTCVGSGHSMTLTMPALMSAGLKTARTNSSPSLAPVFVSFGQVQVDRFPQHATWSASMARNSRWRSLFIGTWKCRISPVPFRRVPRMTSASKSMFSFHGVGAPGRSCSRISTHPLLGLHQCDPRRRPRGGPRRWAPPRSEVGLGRPRRTTPRQQRGDCLACDIGPRTTLQGCERVEHLDLYAPERERRGPQRPAPHVTPSLRLPRRCDPHKYSTSEWAVQDFFAT